MLEQASELTVGPISDAFGEYTPICLFLHFQNSCLYDL